MSHAPTDDAGGAQPPGGVLQLLLQVEQQLGSAVTVARQVVIPYMSQMLYAGQSAREDVPFLSDF